MRRHNAVSALLVNVTTPSLLITRVPAVRSVVQLT